MDGTRNITARFTVDGWDPRTVEPFPADTWGGTDEMRKTFTSGLTATSVAHGGLESDPDTWFGSARIIHDDEGPFFASDLDD